MKPSQWGQFRPSFLARRVLIPKPGRDELRPLSIPAVRDRVVQAAVKTVIRADLRGRLPALLLRLPAEEVAARRAPGSR